MTRHTFARLRALLAVAVLALVTSVPVCAQDALRWPSERPPRPLAARPAAFPPYQVRMLPNGLQVVVVSQHEQPSVSARLIIRAGSAQDPKGRDGVAMLTAALLDQGTSTRTAEQIADQIDFVGGILGTGAGTDLSFINAVVMKDDFALALDLMSDVVRNPAFAEAEINRQRQQALSSLKVAAEDPDAVASRVIDRLIYGFHPYGRPSAGTEASLTALTRQDFVEFHRAWFVPNNALIAVVGDIAVDEALAQVQRAFGAWVSRDVPAVAPTEPPPPVRRIVVIDKPDAVQTEVRVGQLALPRQHPDHFALDQAVKILGGEGANRLQQVLRTQKGLTYGASADLESLKQAGGIVAETDTRTEATAEVLRTTVEEFAKLPRERVYEAELEGAQAFMAGSFPLRIESPDAIATQVLNQLFYDLPLGDLQTYRERVTAVTADDVQRVARAWIRPDRLSVVLVGNASAFIDRLKSLGFTDIERIPIADLDLAAADLRRPAAVAGPGGLH